MTALAVVVSDSTNPDVSLLREINDLAKQAPRGVDRTVQFLGEYGLIALLVLVAGWCWWRVARRSTEAPAAVAGIAWAGIAAGIALLVGMPIRSLVARPRPSADYDGLDVLAHGNSGFAFVSAHATLAAAVAVGVFMVSRRAGTVAILLALAEGFCRIYLGVQYPTDVIGGFALGAATTLLLAPPALSLLTALATRLTRTPAARLIHPHVPPPHPHPTPATQRPVPSPHDKDLAA
jgi:undecaprenyl-diphosphatase